MTEQPTTAAGRGFVRSLLLMVRGIQPDELRKEVLAIEAEARRDYRCDYRCSLPADHGGVHLFPTHTAPAAAPPSVPPDRRTTEQQMIDGDRLPLPAPDDR